MKINEHILNYFKGLWKISQDGQDDNTEKNAKCSYRTEHRNKQL